MKWLKISEIKRRSKTAKGALKVSYEHWNQLYTATAKELRAKIKETRKGLSRGMYCGLCKYNRCRCEIATLVYGQQLIVNCLIGIIKMTVIGMLGAEPAKR